ncbi:hypothetical protein BJ165DRAFT_692474 [Panaeolus papilionaceus]|nr:hypothetical protein BJ165DRAFT_692474 [Panaeolus papilionaceus]
MSEAIDYTPVEQSRQASYLMVSALVIYVYDLFYTLPEEVQYIWRARWSLPKVLYLGVRYWGIFIVACKSSDWAYVMGAAVIAPLVNIIHSMRLYALYERSRKVLYFVSFVCISEAVIQFAVTAVLVREETRNTVLGDPRYPLLGCLGKIGHRTLLFSLLDWIPYLISSCVFFIMTVYKLRPKYRTGSIDSRTNRLPLHEGFMKGGALCFLTQVSSSRI